MKTSLLTEKENKIDQLSLNELERLEEQIEKLQTESDKTKVIYWPHKL